MPFLGVFATARRPSSTRTAYQKDSIKQSLRNASTVSLKNGKSEDQSLLTSSTMDSLKRSSLGHKLLAERRPSNSSPKSSPKLEPHRAGKLDMVVESPPLVSYNTPANSSGALFSGQLRLDVIDPEIIVESFDVEITCGVTVKKPVHQHCPQCTTKTTSLRKWSYTPEPLHLKKGMHPFPCSYLFPGHLPASTDSNLVHLDYFLTAIAKTANGEKISFHKTINLLRSVLPGNDKHSIRVFPPTNLTASVTLNPAVHPIGEFPISLRLSGISTKGRDSTVRWRLRKLNWRIEEHQKMISPGCEKHALKLGGAGKGILHEDTRTIGEADLDYQKTPWKCDFDAGEVDAEFTCAINPAKKPVCDVEAPNGLSVTHNLVIEMVVAEEWTPKSKPNQPTPTGAARILRTQFHLMLTERPGMGVSWDEETPPVYEDVPDSPPRYAGMTDFDIAEVGGQVEEFHLDPNTGSLATALASSSGRRSSSRSGSENGAPRSSADIPGYSRGRFVLDVNDLLSGPPERRESTTQGDEEDEDIQVVQAETAQNARR